MNMKKTTTLPKLILLLGTQLLAAMSVRQMPRTFRPPRHFHGLQELNSYQINVFNDRNFFHHVENNGFVLDYNVTVQEGLYALDEDDNILHIDCDPSDQLMMSIHSLDSKKLLTNLRNSKFIVGSHTWGCTHEMASDNVYTPLNPLGKARAFYRLIESSVYDDDEQLIRVKSHPIPMSHVLEKSSISVYIPPNYVPKRNSQSAGTVDTFYEESESITFSFNYDTMTKRAKEQSFEISDTLACEECYFYFTAGFEMILNVEYGTFYWPFIEYLKIALFGEADASMYIRATNPDVGLTEEIPVTEKYFLSTVSFPIGVIPFSLDLHFQLLTQIDVVESSMDFTLFTGLSADATIEYGIEQKTADDDIDVLSQNDWHFSSSPLSIENSKNNGKFNPRLYMIPRMFVAPYSLIDLFIDASPYIGIELWDASNSVSNPNPSDVDYDDFSGSSRPEKPSSPPEIVSVGPKSAHLKLELAPSELPITTYQIRYYCSNCWDSWFTDYLYPSTIGFFETHYDTVSGCFPSSLTPYFEKPLDDVDGNLITCSEKCHFDNECVAFSFIPSEGSLCKAYDSTPSGSSMDSGSTCSSYDKIVQAKDADGYYVLRDGDPLAYTAESSENSVEHLSLLLDENYAYKVEYRAGNARGVSDDFSDAIEVKIEINVLLSLTNNMYYLKLDLETNLMDEVDLKLKFYEDDLMYDDLLGSYDIATPFISSNLRVSDILPDVFSNDDESNDMHIYVEVFLNGQLQATSSKVNYSPINGVTFSASNDNAFSFYADPVLFSSVSIRSCYTYFFVEYCDTKTTTSLSSFCVNGNECEISYGPSSNSKFYLDACDQKNVCVEIASATSDAAVRQNVSSFLQIGSAANTPAEDRPFRKTKRVVAFNLPEKALTRSKSESARDATSASSCDHLSYSIYMGVALRVGVGKFTIPGLGLVLFDRLMSPWLNIMGPSKILGDYGDGCLSFPSLSPQFTITAPLSSDSWQESSDWHAVKWEYWSLGGDELVKICFHKVTGIEVYCDDTNFPLKGLTATVSLRSYLLGGSEYYIKAYVIGESLSDTSETFSIVAKEDTIPVISSAAVPHDDDGKTYFSGALLSTGDVSLSLGPMTNCQTQYSSFPLSVICNVAIDISVAGSPIYQFEVNGAAFVDNLESFDTDGVEIGFGATFPSFEFPIGDSASSYFFEQMMGKLLTEEVSFPASKDHDLMKLNSEDNTIRLRDLVDTIKSNSQTESSDLLNAASLAESLFSMLGIDASLHLILSDIDLNSIGMSVNVVLNISAFKAEDTDWEIFFNSIDNPTFQNFLLNTGSASSVMANNVFAELTSLLGIDEGVEYSFDVGAALVASFSGAKHTTMSDSNASAFSTEESTPPRNMDSSGKFLLGSSVDGVAMLSPTLAPTVRATSSPTGAPTTQPTVSTPSPTVSSQVPTASTQAPTVSTPSPTVSTQAPTSSVPTHAPVLIPPKSTAVQITSVVDLSGVSSSDLSDDMAQLAFENMVVDCIDGPASVTLQGYADDYDSLSATSRTRKLSEPRVNVTFGTVVVMEDMDTFYDDTATLANDIDSSLKILFADPETGPNWVEDCVELNSLTITASTEALFSDLDVDTENLQVTIVETLSPTAAPTDLISAQSTGGESGGLEVGVVAGIAGVGALLVLCVFFAGFRYLRKDRKSGSDSDDNEVEMNTAQV